MTDILSVETPGAAAHSHSSSSNNATTPSILSEKVTRALNVRTDTPAMKAALEALSQLQLQQSQQQQLQTTSASAATTVSKDNSTNSLRMMDSRSVRTAIEQDALQQALQLQDALQDIVHSVAQMRQRCSQVARTASQVRQVIHTSVVTTETTNTMLLSDASNSERAAAAAAAAAVPDEPNSSNPTTMTTTTTSSSLEDAFRAEEQLAALLSDAFRHRDQAAQRLAAVHAFLEQFDLSAADSDLLDQYHFPDSYDSILMTSSLDQGWAFLQALERVRHIRAALHVQFGQEASSGNAISNTMGGDSNNNRSSELNSQSALRMMEGLAAKQEAAYERLYQWLQQQLYRMENSNGTTGDGTSSQQQSPQDSEAQEALGGADELLQHDFVKAAVYTLRHVPAFYTHTLEMVAASRRAQVTRRFLLALTTGLHGQSPLEMKAHDSVAYVGDMLAFAFQTFSVEADLARGLLQYKPQSQEDEEEEKEGEAAAGDDNDDEARQQEQHPEKEYAGASPDATAITAEGMLGIALSGLARPLKSRILQVVSTLARRDEKDEGDDDEEDSDDEDDFEEQGTLTRSRLAHLYEICGLLLFYASIMDKSLQKFQTPHSSAATTPDAEYDTLAAATSATAGPNRNPLVGCLLDCLSEATKAYEATQRVYSAMLDQLSVMTGESEAALVHSMLILIADVRLKSPGFSVDVECPAECQRILSIEWVTKTLIGAALVTCKTLDDTVSLKQSLSASKGAGMSVTAAEKLDEEIETKENALIDALVETETAQVLDLCGLGLITETWKRWKEVQESGGQSVAMASYPGLSAPEMEAAMKEFYSSLYSPPLPSLETMIKDPAARKMARSKIAETVCATYEELYESAMSSSSGYSDPGFLGHTPDQVKTLFSA